VKSEKFLSPEFPPKVEGGMDPVKGYTSLSLVTLQNVVILFHTMWASVGSPPKNGSAGPARCDVAWLAIETRRSTTWITMPNLIAIGQTLQACTGKLNPSPFKVVESGTGRSGTCYDFFL